MATTSFSNWDFYNFHVQQDLIGGQFVSAESTLVAAGPPTADQTANGGTTGGVYPIGLLESVGLQQSKQLQRIFEIGSTRSYFIPGRVIGSITVGRTFYFGPSLLRVLYAYYNQTNNPAGLNFGQNAPGSTITVDGLTVPDPAAALLNGIDPSTLHTLHRNPGDDYFFIDLASDLFNQPTGMAIYFKDANFVSVGAMYLETCYVQGHQMSVSSGSVLVMEGVSMQYERLVPIKVLIGG
jgi:hypothetical protein